jgi:hypothetical protein
MAVVHIDKNIGVNSYPKVYWMRSKCGKYYWCRKPIAIMGSYNIPHQIGKVSPFDPAFYDNYVEGKGISKEEALANMEKDENLIAESLWIV